MARLTAAKRRRLRKTSFVYPSRRAYPIQDKAHARAALAMVSQHGTPAQKRRVRAAVHKKYPTMRISGYKHRK
ncbi:hypothetical protein [Bifidobacterium cuniculi]|uniref:Uncharacterized protein n=1 Tax=Bifidobacterium cuniculi TaxID=1688 RepID=A0A087B516_9BIFI|nr:hypothetical protein [Bifidobacterium cuniculi]KFI66116.1 hypothetical protein BCUN_0620 [Bifidobacterium cuniculi]